MPGNAVEIAKLAIGHAYIGGIQVAVNDPGYFAGRHLLFPQFVGDAHELCQWGLLKQENPFFHGQELKVEGFLV
jgi:hypothetical protein